MNPEENEDFQEPEETGETTEWPPHKYALAQLEKQGRIRYNEVIRWAELEKLIDSGPREEWAFRGQYLCLADALKQQGFLLTQRGMNDEGVRILSREEMADVIREREHNKANDSLRNSLTLSKVPRDGLEPHQVKKLDHWETKSALVGATAKVLLRKRNLPSPEMAIKSIKQIST